MEWFVPWALLVKPGLTPFPRLGCRVPLHIAAGWVAAMANLPPQPHSHAWGPAGTSALTIGDGVEPVDKSCHRTPASLSWAIILFLSLAFIAYPSSSQPNSKLLGRSYPVILSPSAEWTPKGVLGKLATWPPDYSPSMTDDLVPEKGKGADVWLRSKKWSLSPLLSGLCSHQSCECFSFCDTDTSEQLCSACLCFTDAL